MLADKRLKAIVPTVKPKQAKLFYKDILGFELLSEDNFALEFNANGTLLRITLVKEFNPQTFTVLGWNVDDIVSIIKQLNDKNIFCLQYDFFEQNKLGVWNSPSGAKVAWFNDPDGNILSLTELT